MNRKSFERRKKKVVIVIITHKEKLKTHEKISLNFLRKKLGKYDKVLVISKSHRKVDSEFNKLKFKIMRLEDKYFGTAKGHNNLMRSRYFYDQFKDYEYILKYELDCLVFKDQLDYFCSLNYDYIGAPFIKNQLKRIKDINEIKIRNGGFSLRKVNSFIDILNKGTKNHRFWFIKYYLNNFIWFNIFRIRALITRKISFKSIFSIGEDVFWSIGAKEVDSSFKVAPFNIALSFSFENNIPLSYKLNNNQIPFGCHSFQSKKNLKEWEKLGLI
jgi:hypothetical protein